MKHSKLSRLLSLVMALVMVLSMFPTAALAEENATYTKITSFDELTTGQYVMVVDSGYAPTVLDGTWVLAENVGTTADVITNPDASLVWYITVDGSTAKLTDSKGVTIAPVGGSKNDIKSGDYKWSVSDEGNGTFRFFGQGSDEDRVLASHGSYDHKFRSYKTTTVSGSSSYSCYFTLYKLDEGEAEPERTSGLITELSALQDGDSVVIFNPANAKALSTGYTGFYNLGTDVVYADGVLTGYTDADLWTLGINDDGTYTFATSDGKKLSMGSEYSSTPLDDVNTAWSIENAATADCFYIKNVARGNYLEWYADKNNWSSYYNIGSNEALFAQQIYLVISVGEEPAPSGPDPSDPDPSDPDPSDPVDPPVGDGSAHVVINQIYGGGGNSGAEYKNDFVELYNPTDKDVDLTGWSLQYASATGNFSTSNTVALSGTIKAGGYYLIQLAAGTGGTLDLPTPDATGSTNMSASNCKVALANSTASIAGRSDETVVDFVGTGTANDFETAVAPAGSATKAVVRKATGVDTDNNSADFTTAAPDPHNSTGSGGTTDPDPSEPVEPEEPEEPVTPEGTKATLVTDVKDLREGDEILIVAPSKAAVMGPSAGNYYASVTEGVALSSDGTTVYFDETKSQTLILGSGSADGTWSFNAAGAYLAAVSGSNNHLKNETSVSAKSSWTVEIAADGVATIKSAATDVERNWIRYNASSPRFSCYKSGQADVAIYKVERDQYAELNNQIAHGDEFVIFYNKESLVMTSTANDKKLTGVAATPENDFILVEESMAVLTASVDSNGYYTFTNGEGKYLTSGATGNSLSFEDAASDYSLWTIKAVDGGVHIVSVNAKYNGGIQAMEYYSGFTTYGEKDTDYYLFNLYKLTDKQPPVSDALPVGGKVVIYNLSAEGVLALQDSNAESPSITNALTEIVDGKAVPVNGGLIFTVEQNGTYYRFYNETFGYLCSNGTGNNAFYSLTASEDADWTLTTGKSGGYNLESRTAKFNDKYSQYLEYYAGAYKSYSMYNVTDYDIYEFFFYPVAETVQVTGGVVNAPAVDFGVIHDAYVGVEYTFSFTVDAVFGISDAGLSVTANQTVLTANADGSYTVPVELISGDQLTITVSGTDTKGVAISGTATVAVKDEPVIGYVTPAANTETGDNKRPAISAVISNAGENPVFTMTVNGETVNAVFENGVLTYAPAADLEDGRTTVVVTVTRADGKTAEKTWAFTVGETQYQLFFGQLHSHTTYSDGSGSLETALDYIANLPESANVDFVAFTDHSNYFDSSNAANPEAALFDLDQATAASAKLWTAYKDAMAAFNKNQTGVIAIPGFEMTWSGGPGHINTFNTEGIVSRNNSTLNNKTNDAGMKAYYALLSRNEGKDSISQFNHPGSTFGTFTDFAYWDALIDSRIFLVEVGNGEGAIGAGGYYPSYEYYTMALDKGWHVAPTNNQDNHKGKWGNANDARDVVITDNFSEEGIYEAIRALRMYATEDKNLEIGYTLNGKMMGSTIEEVPNELNLAVTVYDPDSSDSISKVEVIVNSGKVAYTWNNPEDLADGALECTISPNYSYYYIRVTQGDGDLAVTSPVWVGENLKLGISSVEASTSTPVTGEELTLTTTLFNSESRDATVTKLVYTVGSEVIGTDSTGYTIPASGNLTVNAKYIPTVAKVTTVTVTAYVTLNGEEYTFTMDVEMDVQDASKLVYVGIDASHYNEYVSGNYKDSMGNFSQLAAGYSVRTVQLNTSEELIAACSNSKYKALILTAPSRRLAEAQSNPKVYTEAELTAIARFNANGGTVILAGWSDNYENYDVIQNNSAIMHMAATQNAVLEALGSSLRIGDDATYDDSFNGGQPYRLYFNTYGDSFLTEGVEVDPNHPHDRMYTEVFSHYGGASVYTADGTLPATVNPIVFGHSSTYSVDVDKDGLGGSNIPKYTYTEGDDRLMIMATEQLQGKGLIIVSGAAFMSNFEVQATIEDSGAEKNYSNYRICENLLAYINPVTVTPIAEVQAQPEEGVKYTIQGIVTSNASGYDKDTAFFDCIYVQDATGGINAFPVAGNYRIGDEVRITGTTSSYQGERQIAVSSIELISSGNTVAPTEITAAQLNDGSVLGSLVTLSGTVESFALENGLVQTIMVKDEKGDVARIFIDGYITTAEDVKNLEEGCNITVTGLASYDNSFDGPAPRIRIRNRADVICTEAKHNCDKDGHDFSKKLVVTATLAKAATCTTPAEYYYSCMHCEALGTETFTVGDPAEHSYEAVVTEPTCTKEGYTTYTCHCGDSYIADQTPALGHDVVLMEKEEPTCELNGYEYYACSRCGGQECTIILEATGHEYEDGSCIHCGEEDPDADKPSGGIFDWWDEWFDWLKPSRPSKPTEPSEPETQPTEPSEPETDPTEPSEPVQKPTNPFKPIFGGIFDWFFGWWR